MNLQKHTFEITWPPIFSQQSYPHRLYKSYHYTDQLRENMILTRSSWVVERIFALQDGERALKNAKIQHWDLKIMPDRSILLVCANEQGRVIYFEHRDPVEYPKEDLSFTLRRNILDIRNKDS